MWRSLDFLFNRARIRSFFYRFYHAIDNRRWREIALYELSRRADSRALASTFPHRVKLRKFAAAPTPPKEKWSAEPHAEVSIVLGTYNRLECLKLTLKSIRENGFAQPYEIIVVDGGSTDGTIQWLTQQTDVVLVLQHNRNAKRGHARRRSWGYFINLGFKIAEAPWILMVSDDCLLLPGSIESSLQLAQSMEASGRSIGGVAYYFRNWPQDDRYFVQHTIGGMLMVNHGLFSKAALMDVNYANEDDYSFYKADSDLALKLWQGGYEIVDCKSAIVEHLMLPSEQLRETNSQSMNHDRETMIERWKGVYAHPELANLFKNPEQRFIDTKDSLSIAEQFRPLLERDITKSA